MSIFVFSWLRDSITRGRRGKGGKRCPSGAFAEGKSAPSLLARNERRARSKREQRRLSERYRIPPRDTVQWTVATIEVAARSGIPPLRPLQARAATIERTVSNPSAISVSAAGIADASTRCLLRLTRSGRYRLWRFPHWGTASLAPHFDTPKAFVLKQSTKSLLTHTISMANHPNNYNNNLLSVPFFYHIIL